MGFELCGENLASIVPQSSEVWAQLREFLSQLQSLSREVLLLAFKKHLLVNDDNLLKLLRVCSSLLLSEDFLGLLLPSVKHF